ncbi:MAG: DNA polymerase IV [Crenarchaeota archaeon]|nr:DNA polymerase IV [Thermoproteota archaeon]MDA1124142.1 DNA polymerase IV [Thermoproteota archaeon]
MEKRIVFHVDFDYFYAQCEEIRDSKIKGKCVAVCIFSDRGGDSGAIATANYNARKFGVKSGIPIMLAKNKLKEEDAVFLSADFDYYSDMSSKAMEIIEKYADVFEYVGRDEAYLDVTKKTEMNFHNAEHLAQQLKNEIRNNLKLTCSVGITPNKLLSKIASNYKKPDGLTTVRPEQIEEFLSPLKIREIPGIGKKTEEVFTQMNVHTIEELRKINVFDLNKMFGRKTGGYIFNSSKGIDTEIVKERPPTIQFSKIVTLKKNSKEIKFLQENVIELCVQLNSIAIENNKMYRSIGIQFVNEDLTTKTKSRMLKNPVNSELELKKVVNQLLEDALVEQVMLVRRIGVRISEFSDVEGQSSITNYF